jgi:hypothetical protein
MLYTVTNNHNMMSPLMRILSIPEDDEENSIGTLEEEEGDNNTNTNNYHSHTTSTSIMQTTTTTTTDADHLLQNDLEIDALQSYISARSHQTRDRIDDSSKK